MREIKRDCECMIANMRVEKVSLLTGCVCRTVKSRRISLNK